MGAFQLNIVEACLPFSRRDLYVFRRSSHRHGAFPHHFCRSVEASRTVLACWQGTRIQLGVADHRVGGEAQGVINVLGFIGGHGTEFLQMQGEFCAAIAAGGAIAVNPVAGGVERNIASAGHRCSPFYIESVGGGDIVVLRIRAAIGDGRDFVIVGVCVCETIQVGIARVAQGNHLKTIALQTRARSGDFYAGGVLLSGLILRDGLIVGIQDCDIQTGKDWSLIVAILAGFGLAQGRFIAGRTSIPPVLGRSTTVFVAHPEYEDQSENKGSKKKA